MTDGLYALMTGRGSRTVVSWAWCLQNRPRAHACVTVRLDHVYAGRRSFDTPTRIWRMAL
jgi:hypothetical protein